ncbi:MAG: DUF6282 family protein [candidate division NC10 bacterium]|nr:DUF6282 family protein [candidate division NC10 bacterium]
MKKDASKEKEGWSRRDFLRAAGIAGAMAAMQKVQKASAQMPAAVADRRLVGAIDLHIHSAPDVSLRSLNDIELAQKAKELGMRGFIIKNHEFITNDRAYLVRQVVPGIEAFGGIVLNDSVGGLNPAAVERMIRFTGGYGKIVWLPTFDAAHHKSFFTKRSEAGGIQVLDGAGHVLPELRKILRIVARADIILATGHVSPREALLVVRAAKEEGVKRILITHALASPVQMSLEEMGGCVQMGAFIEHVYVAHLVGPQAHQEWMRSWRNVSPEAYAQAIKALGAERSILSSDLGQYLNPTPTDGMQAFIEGLASQGISDEEMGWMVRRNPARLLGLEPL